MVKIGWQRYQHFSLKKRMVLKLGLSEKHTNFEKNPPYGFDVYLVNQLICQNHKEDFFKKVQTLH